MDASSSTEPIKVKNELVEATASGEPSIAQPQPPTLLSSQVETLNAVQPGTSDTVPPDEDPLLIDPYLPFTCSICQQMEKCIYGNLKTIDGYYPFPVYFMRDPFVPRPKVKGRKPLLADFLVLGAGCSLCSAPVCFDKGCSVYFGNLFCAMCIARERKRFPDKVIQTVLKAQSARVKQDPEVTS